MLPRENGAANDRSINRYGKTGSDSAHERVRDQAYIKQYNLQTVMAVLKKYQPISRTDIARMTGMSPTSVTRIVGALLNQGLICECSTDSGADAARPPKRGRKAVCLRVQSNGLYAVGVYLDRSVVRLCVIDFDSSILYSAEGLVDGECTPESTARQAKKLFDRMPEGIIENMERVGAVGVCLNGSVDHITGEVRCSHRMGWKNAAVKAAFEKEFGISAYIENDVKAGLIGEKVRMDIRDEVDTVYLYIGDEMGAAIVSNGMIVRGRQNDAGNIAGISINRNTEEKGMHLGMHLSESGLLRNAQKKDSGIASIDMLFDACRRGEAWAQELIRDFGYHFIKTVAVICGLFDPQKIIIGGGLVHKAAQYLGAEINDERVCFGGAFEESCLSGAAVIALRSAVIERIGQSAE